MFFNVCLCEYVWLTDRLSVYNWKKRREEGEYRVEEVFASSCVHMAFSRQVIASQTNETTNQEIRDAFLLTTAGVAVATTDALIVVVLLCVVSGQTLESQ